MVIQACNWFAYIRIGHDILERSDVLYKSLTGCNNTILYEQTKELAVKSTLSPLVTIFFMERFDP